MSDPNTRLFFNTKALKILRFLDPHPHPGQRTKMQTETSEPCTKKTGITLLGDVSSDMAQVSQNMHTGTSEHQLSHQSQRQVAHPRATNNALQCSSPERWGRARRGALLFAFPRSLFSFYCSSMNSGVPLKKTAANHEPRRPKIIKSNRPVNSLTALHRKNPR